MIVNVRFKKGDQSWSGAARPGETLLDVARRCDAPVHTLCGGIGTCVQCKVRLEPDQMPNLEPPNAIEKDRLGNVFHLTGERLACQAKVRESVEVSVFEPKLPRRRRSGR